METQPLTHGFAVITRDNSLYVLAGHRIQRQTVLTRAATSSWDALPHLRGVGAKSLSDLTGRLEETRRRRRTAEKSGNREDAEVAEVIEHSLVRVLAATLEPLTKSGVNTAGAMVLEFSDLPADYRPMYLSVPDKIYYPNN